VTVSGTDTFDVFNDYANASWTTEEDRPKSKLLEMPFSEYLKRSNGELKPLFFESEHYYFSARPPSWLKLGGFLTLHP